MEYIDFFVGQLLLYLSSKSPLYFYLWDSITMLYPKLQSCDIVWISIWAPDCWSFSFSEKNEGETRHEKKPND